MHVFSVSFSILGQFSFQWFSGWRTIWFPLTCTQRYQKGPYYGTRRYCTEHQIILLPTEIHKNSILPHFLHHGLQVNLIQLLDTRQRLPWHGRLQFFCLPQRFGLILGTYKQWPSKIIKHLSSQSWKKVFIWAAPDRSNGSFRHPALACLAFESSEGLMVSIHEGLNSAAGQRHLHWPILLWNVCTDDRPHDPKYNRYQQMIHTDPGDFLTSTNQWLGSSTLNAVKIMPASRDFTAVNLW